MSSRRTGIADLRLHPGTAPSWLVSRMEMLAEKIFVLIHDEYGEDEILVRLSDPLFFQACSNALGYDWDSSGTTTVTCGVLKRVFDSTDLGLRAAGGKGRRSKLALSEIQGIGEKFDFSQSEMSKIAYASRMTAKVDSVAIQAGYQIYHHMIFVSRQGQWAVIQQGMRPAERLARRYHWLSSGVKSFVDRPHRGIVGEQTHSCVLDMTAEESGSCRGLCTDLVGEGPERVRRLFRSIRSSDQEALTKWMESDAWPEYVTYYEVIPRRMDWDALKDAYETRPASYEELLALRGIGPATVRGLALISEIVFGTVPSWRDPIRFSFAYGGKDGVPFSVDRKAMDESIEVLAGAIESAKVGDLEKVRALRRLCQFAGRTSRKG